MQKKPSHDEIKTRISADLQELFFVPAELIQPPVTLEQMGIDSLDIFNLSCRLDDTFDVADVDPGNLLNTSMTFAELVGHVEKELQK